MIWISDGIIHETGKPKDVCAHYLDEMDHQRTVRCMQELDKKDNKMEEEKYKSLEECRRISPYCSPEAVRKCTGKLLVYQSEII